MCASCRGEAGVNLRSEERIVHGDMDVVRHEGLLMVSRLGRLCISHCASAFEWELREWLYLTQVDVVHYSNS